MVRQAEGLGFDSAGVCAPTPSAAAVAAYRSWLAADMHGQMTYMARPDRVARAVDPRVALEGAAGLLVVAKHYSAPPPQAREAGPDRGRVSAYARGGDYHAAMRDRLDDLARRVADKLGAGASTRVYVDYGPMLERDAGARSGLGFIGRNTMLIDPERGSWLFLGALLVDRPLGDGGRGRGGTCGQCTRCIDACPTGALVAPGVLDARRCISYLTIELKGAIPVGLRPKIGNWVFGCDICNEVCPYNRRAARSGGEPRDGAPPFQTAGVGVGPSVAPRLSELVRLDEAMFREAFGPTALSRAKRRGLVRNACVALGNSGCREAVEPLVAALADPEPLVRGHAGWGLGRLGGPEAVGALRSAIERESDAWALGELRRAQDELLGASASRWT